MSIRSVASIGESQSQNNSYTVITAKEDGCKNNTYRKSSWTTGLELLCQTSQTVGVKSGVVGASTTVQSSDGSESYYCWIALSDKVNEGRKVFCQYQGDIIKLNTDSLDIPEQGLKAKGSQLYFFARKLGSQYVVYRWNQKTITEISGSYNGAGTW